MKPRIRSCQRGSAAIEAIVSATALISIVVGGIGALYVSFAYVWLERAGYEALICLSTTATEGQCTTDLRTGAERALPIGRIGELHLHRTYRQARFDLTFNLNGHDLIRLRDTLKLPLNSSSGARP